MHAANFAGRNIAAALLVAGALGAAAPARAADDKSTATVFMEMMGVSHGEDVSKIDYSERPRLALPGGQRSAPEKPAQKGQPARRAATPAPVVSGGARGADALVDPPAAYKVPTKDLGRYAEKKGDWWNPMSYVGGGSSSSSSPASAATSPDREKAETGAIASLRRMLPGGGGAETTTVGGAKPAASSAAADDGALSFAMPRFVRGSDKE